MSKPTKKPKGEKPVFTMCIVATKNRATMLTPHFQTIHHNRPTVVRRTDFIDARVHEGDLTSLATNLPPEATDDAFKLYLKECKGDVKLAVESFCSKFGQTTDGTKLNKKESQ